MKIAKFISICIFITFCSCNNKGVYENCISFKLTDFLDKGEIKCTDLQFSKEVMRPTALHIEDSILILKEDMDEHILHMYNVNTGEKVNTSISFGNGPGEFLHIQQIQSSDSLLWLSDAQRPFISAYRKKDILFSDTISPTAIKEVMLPDLFGNIVILPNHHFMTTAYNSTQKRLSFYDSEGKFIETKGEYPEYGEILTPFEKIEGLSCYATLSPDKNGIFLFYKQTDLIELYDIYGNLKKRIQGPDLFFPVIKQTIQDESVHVNSVSGQSRDAYFSPLSINGRVYVLYSGIYFNRENHKYLKDQLFVFDDKGNPLQRYTLDSPIFTFTINPTTNKLYGLSDNPEFHVIEYQL